MRLLTSFTLVAALFIANPASAGGRAQSARPRTHIVYPGQTLGMIAKRYNVTLDALCAANRFTRRTPIRPGQRLQLPIGAGEEGPAAATPVDDPLPAAKKRPPATPAHPAPLPREVARKRGWVQLTSFTGQYRGPVVDRRGNVTDAARRSISRVMASWRTGQEVLVDVRLLKLLALVSDHFGGRPLRVVSGYRPWSPTQYTAHSRHNLGRAVDFSIPGVPNALLRDFCRALGAVGVGYYPNSSFVHLDVRETTAYWIDFAGPGERPRYAGTDGRDPGQSNAGDAARAPGSLPETDDHDDAPAPGSLPAQPSGSQKTPDNPQ